MMGTMQLRTLLGSPRQGLARLLSPARFQSPERRSHGERRYNSGRRLRDRLSSFALLGREIAEEGKRVLAVSLQIARSSKAQHDRLCEARDVIEEIRRIAVITGDTSDQTCSRMAAARGLLEGFSQIAGDRTRMMEGLIGSVRQSQAAFCDLGSGVEEVERFLAIIVGLGEETDLLAINAAIEASRAGAHGAGFNTVAREMRLLADKTRAATDHVRQITERMRTSTSATAEAMSAACDSSDRNGDFGSRAVNAITGCLATVRGAEELAAQAADDAHKQISAAETLERRWRGVADNARECTFDADAAAERSMRTISLAARFHKGLQSMADDAIEQAGHGLGVDLDGMKREEESCREAAGLDEMERLRPQVEGALALLERECTRPGPATRTIVGRDGKTSWELAFGGHSIHHQVEEVDIVQRQTGLSATLFVLAEEGQRGGQFVRVATTVKGADGERAVGTPLNPRGSVAPCLLAGQPFYGFVFVLGTPCLAAYAPIRDAKGATIGAWYVGKSVG